MKNHAGMEKNIGIEVGEEKRATAARSMIYQVFSTIFSYPSEPQTAENIINGSMQDSLMELALDLPYASPFQDSGYGIECPGISREDLEITYSALFDSCGGRPSVSMQEMHYSNKAREELWEDILRFYLHFGLDFKNGRIKEMPDHLVIELEFMHYLSFLESGTPPDDLSFRRAETDFLERHLGRWVSGFHTKLAAARDSLPYKNAARMLVDFIKADMDYHVSLIN